MKKLIALSTVLIALAVAGCGTFTSLIPVNATATTAPPPTSPATPTVAATPTQPPPTATATPNPAANPLDVLKRVFGATSIKSFRVHTLRTVGSTTSESTTEVVLPDRFHVVGKTSEIILIGNTYYLKTGTTWKKETLPQGFDISFANWKKLLDDIGASSDVKFIGPDVLDGAPMLVYQYTVTYKGPPALTTTSKVWIGVTDNLPHKSDTTTSTGTHNVSTFYDYNANITINPPIP